MNRIIHLKATLVLVLSIACASLNANLHVDIWTNWNISPNRVISDQLFGTNLVYKRNDFTTNFKQTFQALNMNVMRFPGGTVTEHEFNIYWADARDKLEFFLDYCELNNVTPILVVPTKPFVDNISLGVTHAEKFVRDVNINNEFGNLDVIHWEIGNEYWVQNNDTQSMSVHKYKDMVVQYAQAMRAVDPNIKPFAQVHIGLLDDSSTTQQSTNADLQVLANYINANAANDIEGITAHFYPWWQKDPQTMNGAITNTDARVARVGTRLTNAKNLFPSDYDVMVSEWNVRNNNYTGAMIRASYLPLVYQQLLEAGTDIATQWPLMWHYEGNQSNIYSRLANTDKTLTISGIVSDWLYAYTEGKKHVGTSLRNNPHPQLKVVAFHESGQRSDVFVICRELPMNTDITIDFPHFSFGANNFEVERMTKPHPVDVVNPIGATTLEMLVKNSPNGVQRSGNQLTFKGNKDNKWEVLRVSVWN